MFMLALLILQTPTYMLVYYIQASLEAALYSVVATAYISNVHISQGVEVGLCWPGACACASTSRLVLLPSFVFSDRFLNNYLPTIKSE
jgi:hypothetical protein